MFEIIWNSIIDHIPLWGWIVIFGVPGIVALYYLSPILLPIWRMLPAPVKGIILAIGAGLLAYLGGRYKGRKDADEEGKRRDAAAEKTANEVTNEVGHMSGKEAQDQLHDRWSRPKR